MIRADGDTYRTSWKVGDWTRGESGATGGRDRLFPFQGNPMRSSVRYFHNSALPMGALVIDSERGPNGDAHIVNGNFMVEPPIVMGETPGERDAYRESHRVRMVHGPESFEILRIEWEH